MKYRVHFLALLLAACNHQNTMNTQSNTTQENLKQAAINEIKKPNIAKEWSEIADDIAQKTYDTMKELKQLNQPITVINEQNAQFSNAMHELVLTKLVNKGVIVKTGSDKRFYLNHGVDYVSLHPNGAYMKSINKVANETPNVRVMVTSSLVKDGVYMMRNSEAYYVDPNDVKIHSESNKYISKDLKVVNRCGDKECGK